jgi:hypothetical protein
MVPGEAFDLEEVRGLEEVHIAQELAVEEDLVAEAETWAAKVVPCLEVVQEVQMGVFQEAGAHRNQLEEEVGHAELVEGADVPAHFRAEGEAATT